MKKTTFVFIVALFISVNTIIIPVCADTTFATTDNTYKSIHQAERLSAELSQAVGISISPLLGMAVLGGWHWLQTPQAERGILPWHNQPKFWIPLLLVLGVIVLKDGAKTALPLPKQLFMPVDAAETVLNKGGGLLGLLVVLSGVTHGQYPETVAIIENSCTTFAEVFFPAYAQAGVIGNVGVTALGTVQTFITEAILSFCFMVVWLVSHTINVLILLSPFAFIDMLLKTLRNTILAVLTLATNISAWLGLILSLIIVVGAWFACGRAFRFMFFGTVFTLDLILRRNQTFNAEQGIVVFSGAGCNVSIPRFSYGRLYCRYDGSAAMMEFHWRPWLIMQKCVMPLPEKSGNCTVGKKQLHSIIMRNNRAKDGQIKVTASDLFFHLPPRYHNQEDSVAETLQIKSVSDISFGRKSTDFFDWFRTKDGVTTQ